MEEETKGGAGELGELQWAILRALWRLGRGTCAEVVAAMTTAGVRPNYITVLTVLRRLEGRRLLTHTLRPGSAAFLWEPVRTKAEVEGELMVELTRKVFGGDVLALYDAAADHLVVASRSASPAAESTVQ